MTGKIFLKLIAGVFCLLLLALVAVDYFATNVAKDNYIQNLTEQLSGQGTNAGANPGGAGNAGRGNMCGVSGRQPAGG